METNEITQDTSIMNEGSESIEISKNAKGQFAFKIKVKDEKLTDETLARLDDKINKLESKYGC